MVVVDVNREAIAVREANRVGIPVVALVDTNTDPDPIKYPIPANDDSTRSIKIIVNALTEAIIKAGAEYAQAHAGEPPPAEQTGAAEQKPAARYSRERRPRREHAARSRPAEVKKPEKPAEEKKAPEPAAPAENQPKS
jgi:small subunit ribosomal protein S2